MKMSDNDVWSGLFLAFLLFVCMFLSFSHLPAVSDSIYEGLCAQKILPV